MRFARVDMGTTSFHSKTTADLRIGAIEPRKRERLKIDFRGIFCVVRFSTFATWGNSGIEPDKGKGISSPGTYEASLMWPRIDGERQWNIMSDYTCR